MRATISSCILFISSFQLIKGKVWFFIRMNKLLDEELEEDEKFWNQDSLKEVMSDDFN